MLKRILLALTLCLLPAGSMAQSLSFVVAGQQTVSTSAAALPANRLAVGLVVTALVTNAAPIYVGGVGVTATGAKTGYCIGPSPCATYSIAIATSNSASIYIISGANSSDKVSYAGN